MTFEVDEEVDSIFTDKLSRLGWGVGLGVEEVIEGVLEAVGVEAVVGGAVRIGLNTKLGAVMEFDNSN